MIQRNDSGYLHHESAQDSSIQGSDLDVFRRWVTRRNAARQQIRRLSPRELEVVMLVADGLANKSIAQRLEISVKTIEKHRANAARKLGVGSTAEMVRLAVESDPSKGDAEPPQAAVVMNKVVPVQKRNPQASGSVQDNAAVRRDIAISSNL